MEELHGVLRWNCHRIIKDYLQGTVPDLQLQCAEIRGATNVVGWLVVNAGASVKKGPHGGLTRYPKKSSTTGRELYPNWPVNPPALERLVRAQIPRGVPNEWRSMQDYTLQDLQDAMKHAVAEGKAPGPNVAAALITEWPEPLERLLEHAYRAILRCAQDPES